MKKNIVGIWIIMLLIGTTILPVMGSINTPKNKLTCQSSGPVLEWEYLFNGPYQDALLAVYQTEDDKFVATGFTEDPEGVFSGLAVKLDQYGHAVWQNIETEIQGFDQYSFGIVDVEQTHDGGYIVVGASDRLADLQYGFLWKLSAAGETEWFNSGYSGHVSDDWYVVVPFDVISVVNGYIMVGGAWFLGDLYEYDVDAIMIKTDLNGDVVWSQIYRYNEWYDEIRKISPTLDGGYILGGTVNHFFYDVVTGPDDADIRMIKTDAEGNLEWEHTYGGPENEWDNSKNIFQTTDGGYITNAQTPSYYTKNPTQDWNVWLIKVDKDGNELWNKTYGEYDQGDTTWGMDMTSDGGFVIGATYNHNGMFAPKDSVWFFKTDAEGNVEWDQMYGGDRIERGYGCQQTNDGGYVIPGASSSFSGSDKNWDAIILKYGTFENNRPEKPSKPEGDKRGDPNVEYTFECTAIDPDGDDLYYQWDWGDGEYSKWIGPSGSGMNSEATHEWKDEEKFEIRVKVKDEHGGQSDWSDPLAFSTPRNKLSLSNCNLFDYLLHLLPSLR